MHDRVISTRAYQRNHELLGGGHGYDNQDLDMGALFVARGPSIKTGGVDIGNVANVEIYNFLANMLQVLPAPNNGTQQLSLLALR